MRSHLLARANTEKFQALRHVYQGLLVLVALTAIVAVFIGFHAMASTAAVAAAVPFSRTIPIPGASSRGTMHPA